MKLSFILVFSMDEVMVLKPSMTTWMNEDQGVLLSMTTWMKEGKGIESVHDHLDGVVSWY
jgi:hypothetical protein